MKAKDILSSSLEKRLRHAMVQTLNEFDDRFDDLSDSDRGRLFKIDLKNMFNDIIRANRDELVDYDITYRPIRLRPDNILYTTNQFMEAIEVIEFSPNETENPWFRIYADPSKITIFDAIRDEFKVGVSMFENNKITYNVCGITDCLKILPFLDRYKLLSSVRQKYNVWRDNLVHLYTRS